ncbi:hypothetical protein SAMN05421749_10294 [Acinetobacter marinus]|uniref:Uncharacterized protein n=1 Tax=Acinetobacter marinus TaxID=281375 RepID=A0A1G6HCV9_9GAMM|nr:hypothetical protein [Acinetobacter marinus]SDB91984.1 hypothetical protein SAMN05421749_10294 [Acinetobacter marinus]
MEDLFGNAPQSKQDGTPESIIIRCDHNKITMNETELNFPIHLNTLISILGAPDLRKHDLLWRVVWDDAGIYAEYGTWDNILSMNCLISHAHQRQYTPEMLFSGEIWVNGEQINPNIFQQQQLTRHMLAVVTYKDENEPYSIVIGKNFDYEEAIPKDKYVIQPLHEPRIEFQDFGFKVSIIQELMYVQKRLEPQFDLFEFVKWYDKRKIDLEEEGYDPIAEVTQYFRDLPIPQRLAQYVTEVYQDGGNDIYLQLIRFAEGYESDWDILSVEDARQFPNLKKAVLCYYQDPVIDQLNEMGIDARML